MNCDFMARPSGLRAKKMLKLFIKRGKKAALLQTQAYNQILIDFAADNFKQFGRQNFSVVVIDKAETVSVIRRAQIVPDAILNAVFFKHRNYIPHIIFARAHRSVPDCAEFTAPKNFVWMFLCKVESGLEHFPQGLLVHARKLFIRAQVGADTLSVFLIRGNVGRIMHNPVVE